MKKSHNFAVFVLAAALASTAGAGFAAAQTVGVTGADRAPALGEKRFIVQNEAGDRGVVTGVHASNENPLADRAATLDGDAFTAKSAEGSRYHSALGNDVEVDQATGNPLAERAATLDGKAFTVEHDAPQKAPAFLARFQ